jgi:hypothetical protein
MARVPIDSNPHQRAWRQLLHYVGLADSTPMPVQRASAGIGIGPSASGRETDPPPRPALSPRTMRSEAPRGTAAQRIWPGLRRG